MDRKAPSKSVAASTAALAAAGESSSSGAADGALLLHGKEDKKPGELPAVGGASGSSSPMAVVTVAAARGPSCQAERCAADMSSARRYYRKHKVCEPHSKSAVVLVAGLRQRFCQQCSRRRAMDRKDKSRSRGYSSSAATSMAALAAAAAAGEGSSSGSADGSLPPHEEEEKKPAKLAAVGSASSSTPVPARRGAAAAGGAGRDGPRCQAERCNVDLSEAANYNRRHKVCQTHSKSPVVLVAGLRQRFCQQCSRFHELSEFDDIKRSCRQRLAGHNERRRKSSADAHGGGGGGSGSGDGCRHADQDGRGHQGNPPPNQFQIR